MGAAATAQGTQPAPVSPAVAAQAKLARAQSPVAGARPLDGAKPVLKPQPRAAVKSVSRAKSGDEIYINQVLNNRFKVESKIGEGGFGAVYRGTQLATSRKVALKLLHPEMTKDENLVARFRREGMVLCNLRDAHTITTYDFDQTPDGTLYIAMELLEGKSLHQLFHEEAPLDWKRVFKILTEMCSSLAEAHQQGIVHRDLKPENIYLETRSGNPEFVKILDFGIAKVMRGDSIDPQSPQLTATGQTLGTLEYMSPEQLMGKPLDGRSDVYALGVLAYEMITGRLPFPDAKGPAGLITAQLKQTPAPPSQASAKAHLPKAADRAILKCLEKDKNNRYPDVSALSLALQEVMSGQSSELSALQQMPIPGQSRVPHAGLDMLETRRGDMPSMMPPPMPMSASPIPQTPLPAGQGPQPHLPQTPLPGMPQERPSGLAMMGPNGPPNGLQHGLQHGPPNGPNGSPNPNGPNGMHGPNGAPPPRGPQMRSPPVGAPVAPAPYAAPQLPHTPMPLSYQQPPLPLQAGAPYVVTGSRRSSPIKLIWWVFALLAVGAGVGTLIALLVSK
ncbi:MAG TPA: protein kinase [Kofleriaceae bacterium]|nr:protein kinase [Kofleriaceae bacterium]